MIPQVDVAALLADPHGQFRELRAAHPVVQVQPGLYLLLRHADVLDATADARLHQMKGSDYVAIAGIPAGPVAEFLSRIMVFDPTPMHGVKRRPFNTAFAFPKVNAMRGRIREIADAYVARLPAGEPCDLIETLSTRLPTAAICGLLGLPEEDFDWVADRVAVLSEAMAAVYPMERHGEIEAAVAALSVHVAEALEARRTAPRGDFLTALGSLRGDLGRDDLVMQVTGMLMGGSDTTRSAIPLAVSHILPDWSRHADALEPAIMEALRLDSPIGTLPLWTDADWPVPGGGAVVPAGSMIGLSTLSAMRDPAVFDAPDAFRPAREGPRDLVFGAGPHRCLGSRIAIIEIEEALRSLRARFARIDIPAPAVMQGFGGIRRAAPFTVILHEEVA